MQTQNDSQKPRKRNSHKRNRVVIEDSFAAVKKEMYEGLLDSRMTARTLGIDVRTLQRWEVEGRAPESTKVGIARWYKRADVRAFIQGQKRLVTNIKRRAASKPRKG